METAMVPQKQQALLRPIAAPCDMIEAHKEITVLIKEALEKDVDYGIIPGTARECLLKPGAERLLKAFGCHAVYSVEAQEIDHDRVNSWEKRGRNGTSYGLYRYVVRADIFTNSGNSLVGSAHGSCSSLESKYIERPRDFENTILKMADKRALVAAVLNTFGLSNRFTQDVEDIAVPHHDVPPPAPDLFDKHNPQHLLRLESKLEQTDLDKQYYTAVADILHGAPMTQGSLNAAIEGCKIDAQIQEVFKS